MSRRKGLFTIAGFLLVGGLVIWQILGGTPSRSLNETLREMGYDELAPPSRLFPPGIITTVETLSNGSRSLHLACTMNKDALAPFWTTSSTINLTAKKQIEASLKASAKTLSNMSAAATGNRINQIDITLHNTHIITMSHEDMIKVRQSYLKDGCEEAVLWNLRAGASVCQVGEVLEADLAYRVSGKGEINLQYELELTKEIAAKIEHPVVITGKDEVRGKGLYLGVRVKWQCFQLNDDDQMLIGANLPDRI